MLADSMIAPQASDESLLNKITQGISISDYSVSISRCLSLSHTHTLPLALSFFTLSLFFRCALFIISVYDS